MPRIILTFVFGVVAYFLFGVVLFYLFDIKFSFVGFGVISGFVSLFFVVPIYILLRSYQIIFKILSALAIVIFFWSSVVGVRSYLIEKDYVDAADEKAQLAGYSGHDDYAASELTVRPKGGTYEGRILKSAYSIPFGGLVILLVNPG